MALGYFVTGTDTEIGKTLIASALLHVFRKQGMTALGMKPVAAGTSLHGGRRINDDVETLDGNRVFPRFRFLKRFFFFSFFVQFVVKSNAEN